MTHANVGAQSWTTIKWLQQTPSIAIPVYQREYRWSQATCDKLLQDIRAVAAKPADETHFIGSILAKPDATGGLTLVDGQQRITTLMLLLAAVRDHASRTDGEVAATVNALLSSPRRPGFTRLVPHERFADHLRNFLLGGGDDSETAQTSFVDNYRFLLDRINEDWQQVWEGLQRLEHVTIELGPRSNAQQIFESLNSTGAPLSDDELIHNYVHMGRTHDQQVELERETWVPIEQATAGATREFWRDYLILTADKIPDFTGDFGVYRAFKEQFPDPIGDLTQERRAEWLRFAERYQTILHPHDEADEDVANQLRLLQSFGGTPRPFILAVYDDYRSRPDVRETLIATFEQLQSLFIRRALVGLERDIQMIGRLCRELRDEGYHQFTGIVRRTPEDPSARLALTHVSLPHAGYVLRRLQFGDRTDLDLQVEHIYPQTPKDDWSGDGSSTWGDLTNEGQARYRTLLNTIGNLTLLEASLNQGASNRSFARKSSYYRRSQVPETSALADRPSWDAPAIEDRTRTLVEDFLTLWPRPTGTPMTEEDDLLKVVDLSRPTLRGYPSVFEHAEFNGAVWGDVHTSKQLVVRLVDELCRLDYDRLLAADYGRFVQSEREPRKSYEKLANGRWFYTGWAHQYLLEIAQSLVTEFGLEDALKVKLLSPSDEVPKGD